MWGADDPDCRKPMVWTEFKYDSEKAHFCDELKDCSGSRPSDEVFVDEKLLNHYRELITQRRRYKALFSGNYKIVYTNNKTGVFAFERFIENERILAVFNSSTKMTSLSNNIFPDSRSNWKYIFDKKSNNLNAKDAQIFIHH